MRRTHDLPILLLPLAMSCLAEPATTLEPPRREPFEEHEVLPEGHSPLEDQMLSRGVRRLSVEQLERSIEAIGQLPEGSVQIPDSLAKTLGQPDFRRVTEENLEPSALFMKFMIDLGAIVCGRLAEADVNRPEQDRALFRFSNVDENLRYVLLRFTGIEGAEADPYVPKLKSVFDRARTGAKGERGGMEAVCIALFTSPEFLLY